MAGTGAGPGAGGGDMADREAGNIDRQRVETVAKLVAKALSSGLDEESAAFLERSYELLALVLSDYERAAGGAGPSTAGSRRRERRLMADRRRARRARVYGPDPTAPAGVSPSDGTARYRDIVEGTDPHHDRDGAGGDDDGRGTTLSL